jgi:hypothetical protein
MNDELYSADFVMPGRPWMIVDHESSDDPEEVATYISRMQTPSGTHPIFFTDQDLAERFLQQREDGDQCKILRCDSVDYFLKLLLALSKIGGTRVVLDPYGTKLTTATIEHVAKTIRGMSR